jgi:hypothetical protein
VDLPSPTTAGNNIVAFTDWMWPKLGANGQAPVLALIQFTPLPDTAPVAPDGKFNFPYVGAWEKDCKPVLLPDDETEVENPNYIQDRDPSVTNIFYLGNRIHDLSYKLGFTEEMGNFQFSNFGKEGKELDPVRFMAMSGVLNNQVDNAFMFTPPDGGEPTAFVDPSSPGKIANYIPPFSGMFLFRPVPGFNGACADSDIDASVAWHEYTHGITNRVVGGPDDADALGAQQSGSMGEAWSDWFALHFLTELGLEDRAVIGGWPDANFKVGIRNFALDASPLTYADFGYNRTGPEVHADGEIWSATLWDLRRALVAEYGAKEGGSRAGHLVFDALALSPRLPTFLNMRDAILLAGRDRYKDQDRSLIWRVFANRGMGDSAKSKDASDVHPIPAFDVPGSANGTLRGTVTDADGGVLPGAKIVLGFGEGVANPVAVSGRDGSYSVDVAPGRYHLTVAAPGYAALSLGSLTVTGGVITRDVAFSKNLASFGYGAKIVSGLAAGDPGIALIDDHEFTGQLFEVGKPIVVKLAGSGPATIHDITVSVRPQSGSVLKMATKYVLEYSLDG